MARESTGGFNLSMLEKAQVSAPTTFVTYMYVIMSVRHQVLQNHLVALRRRKVEMAMILMIAGGGLTMTDLPQLPSP